MLRRLSSAGALGIFGSMSPMFSRNNNSSLKYYCISCLSQLWSEVEKGGILINTSTNRESRMLQVCTKKRELTKVQREHV